MIDSFHNADVNFYREFRGQDLATSYLRLVTHKNVTIYAPIIFARKSAANMAEDVQEQYPVLSIQSFSPLVNAALFFDRPYKRFAPEKTVDGLVDGFEYKDLIPFTMRYEVNFACKSESEWDAAKMYFYRKYLYNSASVFKYNLQLVAGEEVYDPVNYKMTVNDVFRTDGVFETSFVFEVYPWVQVVLPVAADAAEISIALLQNTIDQYELKDRGVGIKVVQV